MTTGLADVEQWFRSVLSHINPPSCVEFVRFAGDKGDNATKLKYMDTHLSKIPGCKAGTIAIPPIMANAKTELSATIVRKTAYAAHLHQLRHGTNGYEKFHANFGGFYNEFTRNIYSDIIMPALELTETELDAYIKTSELPSKTKSTSKSKSKTKKNTASNEGRANGSRANDGF